MKIGIDAKWFFSGPVSGQVFMRNVLPELLALCPEDEWHIFVNKKYRHSIFPLTAPNVHLHYVWAGYNMLSNLFVLAVARMPSFCITFSRGTSRWTR